MIHVHGVTKRYGDFTALDDVSFNIGQGEIVGLLGPNGAGKTTLIRTLTGYFEPSAGQITIDGVDVEEDPNGVQGRIGYLPEQTPLYPEMLVQEYLSMVADIRQISEGQRPRLMAEAVWATGLEEQLTKPISALSKGFRQRVGLAQAIMHKPKVLILDEPTSGLDPSQVVHVRELIKRLAETTTVLFSTHILSEVEQVCERAIVLLGGKARADARLADLTRSHRALVALAESSGGKAVAESGEPSKSDDVLGAIGSLPGVRGAELTEGRKGYLTVEVTGGDDDDLCRSVYRLARRHGWELGELRPVVRNLEAVFRELVRDHEAGRAPSVQPPSKVTKLEEARA